MIFVTLISRVVFSVTHTVLAVNSRFPDILQKLAQDNVNIVSNWLNKNRLFINSNKTKFVIYSHQSDYLFDNIKIEINTQGMLQRTYEIKYLGIIMDNKLVWDRHSIYVAKKLRKLNYLFLQQHFSCTHLQRLYTALYVPVLKYDITHWGGAARFHLKPLELLQKHVIKSIYPNRIEINNTYLNVHQLYEVSLLNFVFEHKTWFNIRAVSGKTRTAGAEKAYVPRYKKYHSRIQALYAGAVAYNFIPEP